MIDIGSQFRQFQRNLIKTTDYLAERYGLRQSDQYRAVHVDQSLAGTRTGAYIARTSNGPVVGVSPDALYDDRKVMETSAHESRHQLLLNYLTGIFVRAKDYVVNVGTILAEADVVGGLVHDFNFSLDQIQGYAPIKKGLYEISQQMQKAAGGAQKLYDLAKTQGQQGMIRLIQESQDLRQEIDRFLSSYSEEMLETFGMIQRQPAFAFADQRSYVDRMYAKEF